MNAKIGYVDQSVEPADFLRARQVHAWTPRSQPQALCGVLLQQLLEQAFNPTNPGACRRCVGMLGTKQ